MSWTLTEEAKKLPVPERIALVEEIWDSLLRTTEWSPPEPTVGLPLT
ncbi:MAG TPA: addiction module protein [Pyrinomonadaceae bacterium]|jgi:hypothetical protein|nr:addiction module protein [Pyrinomonadaceae bacterium]